MAEKDIYDTITRMSTGPSRRTVLQIVDKSVRWMGDKTTALPTSVGTRATGSRGGGSTSSDPESDFITTEGWHTEHLLRPVFMGCATRNDKVITIALSSLRRLIALPPVSLSAIPAFIQTMNDCTSRGVDIQFKILQTLLSLLPTSPPFTAENSQTYVLSFCAPSSLP
jgi:Dimerisation and cyclophilin-binding domain of Mon2